MVAAVVAEVVAAALAVATEAAVVTEAAVPMEAATDVAKEAATGADVRADQDARVKGDRPYMRSGTVTPTLETLTALQLPSTRCSSPPRNFNSSTRSDGIRDTVSTPCQLLNAQHACIHLPAMHAQL